MIKLLLVLSSIVAHCGASTVTAERLDRHRTDAIADTISLSLSKSTLRVCVDRKFGIGSAIVKLEKGQWPRDVRLVFHDFKDLEHLEVLQGTRKLGVFRIEKHEQDIVAAVPNTFLNHKEKSFKLEWIDYYR